MTPSGTIILVQREDPWSKDAQALLDELSAMLAVFSGDSGQSRFCLQDVCSARGAFLVARNEQGIALGCGAFRRFDYGVAEVKRLYSRPDTCGVGTALLAQLEAEAAAVGYHKFLLETRAVNRKAIAFYERNGFQATSPYGIYVHQPDARCFEKAIIVPAEQRRMDQC
ncbi:MULTISPECIES: GNAT family N-acetyltransferase [unclassified Caballeronia]|uniref:GNAT family N-acetyltransferase n=1 Tax=unclassified Caballeronia TaxID=2646786 RepID=UPI002859A562|nr:MULTISPECIES: GNAT family N-acetyltransferase [unclassified Caballeronia]MDR5741297.1 GNAT family N-acetyltransferase [Caballeronia sp. LZ016]MDR5807194.1 GNAT family N-acetyltransferase [Caballeronia sp. LZ019]